MNTEELGATTTAQHHRHGEALHTVGPPQIAIGSIARNAVAEVPPRAPSVSLMLRSTPPPMSGS